jgi:UDP-glucuronate decarboxylase
MTTNKIIKEDLQAIYISDIDWSFFYNKTILVSGANGFLPAYLVESLLFLNYINPKNKVKVFALVRNIKNFYLRFSDYINDPNLEFLEQDVCEPILKKIDVDYVIHAASQASPKFYGIDPIGTLKPNILGTINLLELSLKNNIKSFLYFSSGEVYGEVNPGLIPIEENSYGYLDPIKVRSCYAESKRMAENICVSYHHQYQLPVKIVRPFHTYGPKMKLDDGRVYADFVSNILKTENIILKSDGLARRAFCYLTDATIGFFKILLNGENGNAYNLGNPNEEYSIIELAEILIKLYPSKGIKILKQIENSSNNYLKSEISRNTPNINKISGLNWKPNITAEEGFKRTINSYFSDKI